MIKMSTKNMGKLVLLAVLVIAVVWASYFINKQMAKPESTVVTKGSKLATNFQNNDVIEVFNKYADSEDIIEVRSDKIDVLNSVKRGNPVLIFGKGDDPLQIIGLAKQKGIKMLGYNLEDIKLSKEELLEEQSKVYELAKQNGLKYIFAPLTRHVVEYGSDLAKNTDGIVIQLRNFQMQKDFEEEVERLIVRMKEVNPEIEIWVQIDTTPNLPKGSEKGSPTQVKLTAMEILEQIRKIEDKVEVVSIYYSPNEISVVEEIFKELRSKAGDFNK